MLKFITGSFIFHIYISCLVRTQNHLNSKAASNYWMYLNFNYSAVTKIF